MLRLHFLGNFLGDGDPFLPVSLNYLVKLAQSVLNDDLHALSALGDQRGARADLRDIAQRPLRRRELSVAAGALRAVHQMLNRTLSFSLIDIFRPVLLGDGFCGECNGTLVGALRRLDLDLELRGLLDRPSEKLVSLFLLLLLLNPLCYVQGSRRARLTSPGGLGTSRVLGGGDLGEIDEKGHGNGLLLGPFAVLGHGVGLGSRPLEDIDRLQSFLLVELGRDGHFTVELVLELVQRMLILDLGSVYLITDRRERESLLAVARECQVFTILLREEGANLDSLVRLE